MRSPQEALSIIEVTLQGVDMAFNDELLAELDAALMGGPAPAAEPAAAQPLEELPDFGTNGTAVDDQQDARDASLVGADQPEPDFNHNMPYNDDARPSLPTVGDMSRVTEALREDTDAMERQADALEAVVLELSRLNQNLLTIMELLVRGGSAALPPQAEPVQTAAAPTPRRRRAPSGSTDEPAQTSS